jgi:molecular chaperone GrpE
MEQMNKMDEPFKNRKAHRTADEIIEAMKADAREAEESAGEEVPPEPEIVDGDKDAASAEVEALTAERDGLKDQWLRTLAEFDNYRKRTARDHERMRKTAAESLLRDLLPILDNLERAVGHAGVQSDGLAQGVEMVMRQFQEVLSNHGLKEIPALGEVFDPNVHEAVSQEPSDTVPEGAIVREFQKGYKLGEHIIRSPRVSISMGAPAGTETNQE